MMTRTSPIPESCRENYAFLHNDLVKCVCEGYFYGPLPESLFPILTGVEKRVPVEKGTIGTVVDIEQNYTVSHMGRNRSGAPIKTFTTPDPLEVTVKDDKGRTFVCFEYDLEMVEQAIGQPDPQPAEKGQ